MKKPQIINLKKSILEDNDTDANLLRSALKKHDIFYVNIMSSPGSGKTSTILRMIENLSNQLSIAVMEADIDSDIDAHIIAQTNTPVIQLHTGGMCHLDAEMSKQGIRALHPLASSLLILENIGNLICPAEFDTGAHMNVVILSVPEGDDKPLKYPLIFERCDAVIINKIDSLPSFDFDMEKSFSYIHERNPHAKIFPISAKTGVGIDLLCDWLKSQIGKVANE